MPNINELLLDHREEIESYRASFVNEMQRAADRGDNPHQLILNTIDDVMKRISKKTSCTKGCAFCCNSEIVATDGEFKIISRYIDDKKIVPNMDRLKLHNENSDRESFKKLKFVQQKCSMLKDDNTCSIYSVRPAVCRTHNSASDPEDCNPPWEGKSPKQAVSTVTEALQMALYTTAGWGSEDDVDFLHQQLSKKFNILNTKKDDSSK